ncbi:ANTAR domain-containing response regulator [Methyloligella solikamskensis]|uniref:ANTAR domain-containing response regulator n=1 Tax=Methyloligella solikamskensis TaxID=1177756 RepID=A0ABW3J790_9HYPH
MLKSLRDLRSLRVQIFHPKDRDGDDLAAQIRRIGCEVEIAWPLEDLSAVHADIAFLLCRQEYLDSGALAMIAARAPSVTLIGIIEAESPHLIDTLAKDGTVAVVTKPIRPFGLLTTIVLAHNITTRNKISQERISKLETRLTTVKNIERAKSILMMRKGITEKEAYESIRNAAMKRRVNMELICNTIIEADEVYGP